MPGRILHGQRGFIPSEVDERILTAINDYYCLTVDQILCLFYRPSSRTGVQTRMKRLTDAGYTQALFLNRGARAGSSPLVYRLNRRGRQFLAAQEIPVPPRFRPGEDLEDPFLRHTLAVNDVLIAARKLTERHAQLSLAQVLHERVLKHAPLAVELDGKWVSVIPDGFLDFREELPGQRPYQSAIALELDRGTMKDATRWRAKIAALLTSFTGAYQERFGAQTVTIAVVTTAGAKRCRDLLRWTEEELAACKLRNRAELFLFTDQLPECDPERFFLSRHCAQPFGTARVPLLLLEGVNSGG